MSFSSLLSLHWLCFQLEEPWGRCCQGQRECGGRTNSPETPVCSPTFSPSSPSPPKNSPALSPSNLVSNILRVVCSLWGELACKEGFPQVRRPRPLPLTRLPAHSEWRKVRPKESSKNHGSVKTCILSKLLLLTHIHKSNQCNAIVFHWYVYRYMGVSSLKI